MMQTGKFYVVATPIGNRKDITLRALEVLQEVDLVFCEDARKTGILLKALNIQTPVRTLHPTTQSNEFSFIVGELQKGKNFALVSDAGTPGISDPGSHVIRYLRSQSIPIVPIPGATAWGTLLSVSGFQANPTLFLGFLSTKKSKKRQQLEKAKAIEGLIILYESVHKLQDLFHCIQEIFPNSEILIGRELTKTYEEILYYPNPGEFLKNPPRLQGEFTILINNHTKFN